VLADAGPGGYVVSPRRSLCGPRSNPLEGSVASFNRSIQILLGVGQRKEPGFELGRGKIDSLLHHLNKELGKSLCIAHLGSAIVPDRTLRKKRVNIPVARLMVKGIPLSSAHSEIFSVK